MVNGMTELKLEDLQSVTGGIRKEKTITVEIKVSGHFDRDITVKPYIDGQIQISLVKIVDMSTEYIHMNFKGSTGTKLLKVKLNDTVILNYELNFDTGTYKHI